MLSKFSGQIGPKPEAQMSCVQFNNLIGLAVLMESALNFRRLRHRGHHHQRL
jgi:hypothetical protein